MNKILVIDENGSIFDAVKDLGEKNPADCDCVAETAEAISLLKQHAYSLILFNCNSPQLSSLSFVIKAKEMNLNKRIVFISSLENQQVNAEAIKLGILQLLLRPFSLDELTGLIQKGLKDVEQDHAEERNGSRHLFPKQLIAESSQMKQIMADLGKIAHSTANVLISGESGTGKEVIASLLHYQSFRAQKPFIKVSCPALPESLIESEFFGHEKGSFTGAMTQHPGRFELANGGTLMLDEVTEIPIGLQAKLLRAIQEQEFERIGGIKPIQVDVRLISTTNRDVKQALTNRVIRKDLYYRLSVVPIWIPPLRERIEDIIPLAEYFLERYCFENHLPKKQLTEEAKRDLKKNSWPGNVRELGNVIERAVVLDKSLEIAPEHLLLDQEEHVDASSLFPSGMTLSELEKRLIKETLHRHENDRSKTAEALGISTRSLAQKLRD